MPCWVGAVLDGKAFSYANKHATCGDESAERKEWFGEGVGTEANVEVEIVLVLMGFVRVLYWWQSAVVHQTCRGRWASWEDTHGPPLSNQKTRSSRWQCTCSSQPRAESRCQVDGRRR